MPIQNIVIVSALLAIPALAQTIVDDSQCDCFLTNGTTPTYFKSHGFWDFRSLSQYAVVNPPGVLNSIEENANADFVTPYLNYDSEFGKFWYAQTWNNGNKDFPNQNTLNNLYIERNRGLQSQTYLAMRTARPAEGFQTSSEFESRLQLDHVSMRMHAMTAGASGGCTSIFTYREDEDGTVEETDIEVLTRDPPTTIRYTNQPSYNATIDDVVPGASHEITLPDDKSWDTWATHRLDWTPGLTTWFVDGQEIFEMTFQAPTKPAQVHLNAWSNGDEYWSGKMPVGGRAYQYIQWIELLYDVTDKASCPRVCSVDASPQVGKAVRV
ncbi:Beta-glucanase [Paramyrothecium foliicola]|nr:Beta-glucanase [Paramyrothecium foliicola]